MSTPEDRAKKAEYERNRRASNPAAAQSAITAYKKWRAKNLEYARAQSRTRTKEWYKKNRDRALARSARKYREDPEEARKRQNGNLKNTYGITLEQKELLFEAQDQRCAICQERIANKTHRHVDHDHKTKVIRGILCHHCNHVLGAARDDTKILFRAIRYLQSFKLGGSMHTDLLAGFQNVVRIIKR